MPASLRGIDHTGTDGWHAGALLKGGQESFTPFCL